jgi:hypothetical protein
MHHQIKEVIRRLEFKPHTVLVELTAGEQTPLGRLLCKVYYQTYICDVIEREFRFGFPHNGGQHTFTYRGPWQDAVAMLELMKETLMDNFNLSEEERQVASEFSYISQEILAGRRLML